MPFFQYVPILTPIHSPIRTQYNQIQTYTSSNTDLYKHHRPMHTSLFSILAFLYANTGIDTVKLGAPASIARGSELSKPYTAARLLVVGIEFLGVLRQPNCPRSHKFLERQFGGMSLHRRVLGRQNHCQCPYFRICGLMRGRDFDIK